MYLNSVKVGIWVIICLMIYYPVLGGSRPMNESIKKLSLLLKESKYAVVLTGAGMSTESGIPDFRSKDGWWKKIDPSTVATINALENNYEIFREFYKHRISSLEPCTPNKGHEILGEWEKKGLIKSVITQNIDGFHGKAGNYQVYELHGMIDDIRCHDCERKSDKENFMNSKPCAECGGRLRPGVVLFGENLPARAWNDAQKEIMKSDLVIVIGTSLNVSPFNGLPFLTKGKKVLINMEKTEMDDMFDLVINDKIGKVLSTVADNLK
jgi:NAD-dependent deacetylase